MEGKDYIKDLFSEKLGNFEAKVNPDIWAKVASQIGATTTTAVSTGMSMLTKLMIGLGISTAAITTAVILMNTSTKTETNALTSQVEQQTQSTTEESSTNQPNTTTLVGADSVVDTNVDDQTLPKLDKAPEPTKVPEELPIVHKPYDEHIVLCPHKMASIIGHKFTNPTIIGGEIELFADPNYVNPDLVDQNPPAAKHSIAQYTNVFSPNGDTRNDFFSLKIEGVHNFSIVIMSMAEGKAVFKSSDPKFSWDGRDLSSNPVPDGEYMYIITGYDADGNPVPEYRKLTIRR